MPYRAQFSTSDGITCDAKQSAVLQEGSSSLLQPAIKLPSSDIPSSLGLYAILFAYTTDARRNMYSRPLSYRMSVLR
jgi:hypothetical protein